MENQLAKVDERQGAMEVRSQVNQIQYLMQSVLKENEHYGVVPGTGRNAKPSLFQAGAEKIAFMFHLIPKYKVSRTDYANGHREYEVHCTLFSRDDGSEMGFGIGTCSTLESKYRYRNQWVNGQKTRVENQDIADTWNTCLKMAKKRAFVDAVKSTTAASDIFTQDVEDMPQFQREAEYEVPETPQQPARPGSQLADEAKAELRSLTDQCVASGHDGREVAQYLFGIFQTDGMDAVRAAASQMLAIAPKEELSPTDIEW